MGRIEMGICSWCRECCPDSPTGRASRRSDKLDDMRFMLLTITLALGSCGQDEQRAFVVEYYEESDRSRCSGYILTGGSRTGQWTYWRESGAKEMQGEYRDGFREGTWTMFNEREEVSGYVDFRRGKEVPGSRVVVCE